MAKGEDRIGETNRNKNGSEMRISEYYNADHLIVRFSDGYTVKNTYSNFKKGLIKNPYDKTIYGVGFIGIENYSLLKNISSRKSYQIWRDIFYRCYSNKGDSYKDCYVCEEWKNYSNFENWFLENYYEVNHERVHIDKDLILKGNREYSPKFCLFLPQTINQIFQTHEKRDTNILTGVAPYGTKKFIGQCSVSLPSRKRLYSQPFDSENEARQWYLKTKREYILFVAEYYKSAIPENVYNIILERGKEYEY
jgi:hypothetical protein